MRPDNLVFDGRHMLYRTSDAFRMLSANVNGKDIGCGGMYGFLNVAVRIFRRYGGKVWVAWEGDRSRNFRRILYPEYKRKPKSEAEMEGLQEFLDDMNCQEARLKAMLRAMGVRQFEGRNCEADDVISWIATDACAGESVLIYTGDSDLRQLVSERVAVVSPGFKAKDAVYDTAEAVVAKHGVPPDRIADLKALSGDSSDNIPGIRSVGPKTAVALLSKYGTLDQVLAAAKEPDPAWPSTERIRKLIADGAEDVLLYRRLTGLLESPEVREILAIRSQKTLVKHFSAYKFRSLLMPNEMIDLMNMGKGHEKAEA